MLLLLLLLLLLLSVQWPWLFAGGCKPHSHDVDRLEQTFVSKKLKQNSTQHSVSNSTKKKFSALLKGRCLQKMKFSQERRNKLTRQRLFRKNDAVAHCLFCDEPATQQDTATIF